MVDPFPLVGGQGLQRLADNGVEVVVGCEEERCHEMNRPFLHRVTYGLPLGFLPLAYQGHCFRRPDRGALLLGEGAKVLKVADAVVVAKDAGEAVGTGLAALEELEQAGDLQASVVRVVVVPTLGLLPLEHPLWGREGVRRVVLTEAGGEGEVAAVLRAKGVEVLCETGNSGFAAVGATLQEMGMLSALWLVGPEGAKAAVSEGVVHELAVHAPLEEADEVDGVESEGGELAWAAKRFGRPMKVSVMTCDALGEDKACVLTLQVDEEAEAEG